MFRNWDLKTPENVILVCSDNVTDKLALVSTQFSITQIIDLRLSAELKSVARLRIEQIQSQESHFNTLSVLFYLSFKIFIHKLINVINMLEFFLNFLKYP